MNELEYQLAMLRIDLLMNRHQGSGPPLDSAEGEELDRLVGEVVEYEEAHYRFMPEPAIAKQLIVDLRGGYPDECDFCGEKKDHAQLEPEEAGQWICHACIDRETQARERGG